MKSISLKTSNECWVHNPNNNNTNEITFNYLDGEGNTVLSKNNKKSISIDKELFSKFWEEISHINFNKVLLENQELVGLEGYTFSVELLQVRAVHLLHYGVLQKKGIENEGGQKVQS